MSYRPARSDCKHDRMWLIGRFRLKELVNHVGRSERDNLYNLGVAVARFAGGTELRVGNVTTSFFFRRAPVPSFPGRSFLSVSGNAPAAGFPSRRQPASHVGHPVVT